MARIPNEYNKFVLNNPSQDNNTIHDDPNCIALIKNYQSLVPLAQEARKPLFHLKPADGAIGAHVKAVQHAYKSFKELVYEIAKRTQISMPHKKERQTSTEEQD